MAVDALGVGVVSGHSSNVTTALLVGTHAMDTARTSTEHARSTTRAKHLKLAHANPAMHVRRLRVAALLHSLFGEEKQVALAAIFGVSRTLALRWLDAEMVDKNPAPLALLHAVDEETFERIVDALRRDRAAARDGR